MQSCAPLCPPSAKSSISSHSTTRLRERLRLPSSVSDESSANLEPSIACIDNPDRRALKKSNSTSHLKHSIPSTANTRVEKLFAQDTAFTLKIDSQNQRLEALTSEKQRILEETLRLKKRIRGVHAVKENDGAVAHCLSIMRKRVLKAEKEYMTTVTCQRSLKEHVDTMRRELLMLKALRKKLDSDVLLIVHTETLAQDRLNVLYSARSQLCEDVADIEQKGELALIEQRLRLESLPSYVSADRDASMDRLVQSVKERSRARVHVKKQTCKESECRSAQDECMAVDCGLKSANPKILSRLLKFSDAYRVIHNVVPYDGNVVQFVERFLAREQQILTKHTMNVGLEKEAAELQKQFSLIQEKEMQRSQQAREKQDTAVSLGMEATRRIKVMQSKIENYTKLREQRKEEEMALIVLLDRCLHIVQAKKSEFISKSEEADRRSQLGINFIYKNMTGHEMLELLQKQIREIAGFVEKYQDHEEFKSSQFSISPRRLQALSTHVRPKDPAGTALTRILSSVQIPSMTSAAEEMTQAEMLYHSRRNVIR